MKKTATILAEQISHGFTVGKIVQPVIRNIDLSIFNGELTLIIGPSGSGKSTLLAILSGLLRPDSGRVQVNDATLTTMSRHELEYFRLMNCGFVFQGFNLFAAMTALDNVILPLVYGAKVPKKEATRRASEALDLVGLSQRKTLRPTELSGGEKQRVAIARALVKDPPFLFADEPTSALDKHNGQTVVDLLHNIAREKGYTVLAVSHDSRLIDHADRVITIEDGHITDDTRPIPERSCTL
ncbi:Lipoprotein-releasing system ATP-binding protein LolD [Serratia plymuthica]|uniref:ABC transporter ATP-binding protein n=1 Tax=Serratia plymuthica S13 TaxID=1348660 RepID=S4YPX6_SERPL|nr:ABC transporter ATP-binding protein [Serratia plymuthica]AGP47357.1 ABC transporter ATP-binding protein [Serratia plymuthica S13]KYG16535.1 Lipoprotein-releasing system ATP-binding protein LolD [Serratia plymuthica]QQT84481.1 ABC transporter ATP-binding protein [Serratia plymuthica]